MCYHKSFVKNVQDLLDNYSASFQSITEELEIIKERFSVLMKKDEKLNALSLQSHEAIHNLLVAYSQKDALPSHYTKPELTELKWCLKNMASFRANGIYRYLLVGFWAPRSCETFFLGECGLARLRGAFPSIRQFGE
jgi:hypothetical protein